MFRYDLVQVYSGSKKEKELGELSVHFQPSSDRVVDDDGKMVEMDLVGFTQGSLPFAIEQGYIISYKGKDYTVMKVKDYTDTSIPHAMLYLKQIRG